VILEKAAVSQSIRNWKLLSDLKETATSVHIKGEEAGKDFSVFSRQNMITEDHGLPSYERLINRISFKKLKQPPRVQSHSTSLLRFSNFQKSTHSLHHRNRVIGLISLLSVCILLALVIILL
jgi:hypothetical protein